RGGFWSFKKRRREGSGRQARLNDSSGESESLVQPVDPLRHFPLGAGIDRGIGDEPERAYFVGTERERPDGRAATPVHEVVRTDACEGEFRLLDCKQVLDRFG